MTLAEFVENYRGGHGGHVCISIAGYCEEESYDYFAVPTDDYFAVPTDDQNYKPSCLAKEPWWKEVKDREIKFWNILGGGMYKTELTIHLK